MTEPIRSCLTLRAVRAGEGLRWELHSSGQSVVGSSLVPDLADARANLQRILNRIRHHAGGNREDAADLEAVMDALSTQLLGDEIHRRLADADDCHLSLVVDPSLPNIPWELLRIGGDYLCQRFAVGRVLTTFADSGRRDNSNAVQFGVVANPDFSLPGTVREADLLQALFWDVHVATDIRLHHVTRDQLLSILEASDWLHFAGHASRDANGQLGWQLSDGHFGAAEIEATNLSHWPRFIFAHACASAERDDTNGGLSSMAHAFLSASVRHFLGTTVPVLDEPCREFAKAFYESVLRHESIGIAVRTARRVLREKHDNLLWATYVLYGDPATVLLPERTAECEPESEFPIPCTACGRPIRSRHGMAPGTSTEPVCRRCARETISDGIRPPPAVG